MSKYVGLGNQILLFHYRTVITWDIFNNNFTNLFSSGIIKCDSCLQLDDASHFTVKAGLSLFIKPKNQLNEIVKMETTTDFQLGITNPTTEKFLVAEYDYQQDSTHGVDFLLLDSSSIDLAYHVVIAELIYDGSNNLVGFNYSTQTKSYGIHSHDQQYYNKIESDNRFVNINGDTMSGTLKIDGTTKSDGNFYAGNVDPTNSTRLNYDGHFYATKIYNAIYNDIAEFIETKDEIKYGYAYTIKNNVAVIAKNKKEIPIGIASDTYGYGLGKTSNAKKIIPIGIAGFVLAYVDNEYKYGTPLVVKQNGILTKANLIDKIFYRNRIIAYFYKTEKKEKLLNNIEVKNRKWVKII